jgi:hypothetical protein
MPVSGLVICQLLNDLRMFDVGSEYLIQAACMKTEHGLINDSSKTFSGAGFLCRFVVAKISCAECHVQFTNGVMLGTAFFVLLCM